jgi:hypothetical protein
MNKRLITLVVLGASAAFGWFLSSTYVRHEAFEQQNQPEPVPVASFEAATSTEPLPPDYSSEPISATPANPILPTEPKPRENGGCYIGGCSSQLCSESTDLASTCEWRESYACFATATCERQSDGACGWTESPELKQCLANPSSNTELEAEVISTM